MIIVVILVVGRLCLSTAKANTKKSPQASKLTNAVSVVGLILLILLR